MSIANQRIRDCQVLVVLTSLTLSYSQCNGFVMLYNLSDQLLVGFHFHMQNLHYLNQDMCP